MNQASAPAPSSGTPRTPQIIFADWREVFHQSGLNSVTQTVYNLVMSKQ